jgi:hypothetical protein
MSARKFPSSVKSNQPNLQVRGAEFRREALKGDDVLLVQ